MCGCFREVAGDSWALGHPGRMSGRPARSGVRRVSSGGRFRARQNSLSSFLPPAGVVLVAKPVAGAGMEFGRLMRGVSHACENAFECYCSLRGSWRLVGSCRPGWMVDSFCLRLGLFLWLNSASSGGMKLVASCGL